VKKKKERKLTKQEKERFSQEVLEEVLKSYRITDETPEVAKRMTPKIIEESMKRLEETARSKPGKHKDDWGGSVPRKELAAALSGLSPDARTLFKDLVLKSIENAMLEAIGAAADNRQLRKNYSIKESAKRNAIKVFSKTIYGKR
jgi:hypothetical protein